jgi:iron complex transport system ATP-binding protein
MKKVLEISDLSIGYKSELKSKINLQLFEGEFVCLIGPNGIGKSTLLKTISKLIPPMSGNIKLLDRNINELNPRQNFQTYCAGCLPIILKSSI